MRFWPSFYYRYCSIKTSLCKSDSSHPGYGEGKKRTQSKRTSENAHVCEDEQGKHLNDELPHLELAGREISAQRSSRCDLRESG